MIKKFEILLLITVVLVFLVVIPVFTNKVFFADTTDYFGVAKYFYGGLRSMIRNTHSWDYGLFLSFLLKIWNSIIFLRIVSSLWLILTSLVLYKLYNNKKLLIMWFLSPIVWYLAPYIHPLPMAAFLLTCSYYFIKKYETLKSKFSLIVSGLLLGLSALFWDGVLILSFFYILAFFFNKKLYEIIYFMIAFGTSFSLKLITDYVLFGFPLFSTFRQLGSTFLFAARKAAFEDISSNSYLLHFIPTNFLLYLVIICPLFFLIYRGIKKYKEETAFVLMVFLFFLLNNQPRYTLIIAPLSLLVIAKEIKDKELIVNSILSIILIGYLLYPAFIDTTDYSISEDLKKIESDFPNEIFLAGSSTKGREDDYLVFSTLYYGDKIKEFVSWQDYNLAKKNETIFYEVKFDLDSRKKVNELRNPYFKLGTSRTNSRDYSEVKYLISREKETELENFKLVKEYTVLNVYKMVNNSIPNY